MSTSSPVEGPTNEPSKGRAPDRHPRVIRRHLAVGFGLIAAISTFMCVMLLGTVREVTSIVDEMRREEATVQRGIKLSAAAREQYSHIAHSIVEGDRSHLAHYGEWEIELEQEARALLENASDPVAESLHIVLASSREMDRIFREELLPAAERRDAAKIKSIHRRVEPLSLKAASQADVIAVAGEQRMADLHDQARRVGWRGVATGFGCIGAVLLVAVVCTSHLWSTVLRPLAALTRAASHFGQGEFWYRVGAVGKGELAELSRAFDRMAEELAKREKDLLRKERMAAIGQVAVGVAHEINNPIGIIRGYVKTMLPEASDPKLREELLVLDEEAAACERLTGDLLACAEVPEIHVSSIEMARFLRDGAARLRDLAAPGRNAIEVDAREGTIDGDRTRLRQVLVNLLRNALQASPPGAPVLVSGHPSETGGYVFMVDDRGAGIAEEDRSQVFEPFFSKRSGGAGLGLAVTRSLVAVHGGEVVIESSPAGGARFQVVLPPSPPAPNGVPRE